MTLRQAIVDLDGTVYRGGSSIPEADSGIQALRDVGVDVVFFTNNASNSIDHYVEKLSRFGIDATDKSIITSAKITADFLGRTHVSEPLFVVGEPPLVDMLTNAGLAITNDPQHSGTVVVGLDRSFNYNTLTNVLRALDDETLFVATNADRTRPGDDGPVPSTGGLLGAVTGTTGRQPDRVVGKPSEIAIDYLIKEVGIVPEQAIMIGDRLDTDIRFGVKASMETVLVLTGVTEQNMLDGADQAPDYVLDSLADIGTLL